MPLAPQQNRCTPTADTYFCLGLPNGKTWAGPLNTITEVQPAIINAAELYVFEPRADALRRAITWTPSKALTQEAR